MIATTNLGNRENRPVLGGIGAASVLSTVLPASVSIGATSAAAATCASLAGLALPDTTITAAQPVAAGTYAASDGEVFTNLPAFCRIAATLTPTSGFEHQDRGLDAVFRLERPIRGNRQWRHRRAYSVP